MARFHPNVYKEIGRQAARAKNGGFPLLYLKHLYSLEERVSKEKEANQKEARDLFEQGYQAGDMKPW